MITPVVPILVYAWFVTHTACPPCASELDRVVFGCWCKRNQMQTVWYFECLKPEFLILLRLRGVAEENSVLDEGFLMSAVCTIDDVKILRGGLLRAPWGRKMYKHNWNSCQRFPFQAFTNVYRLPFDDLGLSSQMRRSECLHCFGSLPNCWR